MVQSPPHLPIIEPSSHRDGKFSFPMKPMAAKPNGTKSVLERLVYGRTVLLSLDCLETQRQVCCRKTILPASCTTDAKEAHHFWYISHQWGAQRIQTAFLALLKKPLVDPPGTQTQLGPAAADTFPVASLFRRYSNVSETRIG